MKTKLIILCTLLIALMLSACAEKTEVTFLENVDKQVETFNTVTSSTVELTIEEVAKLYEEMFSDILSTADKLMPGLKSETDEYLEGFKTKMENGPYSQGLIKGINISFTLLMQQSLKDMEKSYKNTDTALKCLNQAKLLYSPTEAVANRRGQMVGSKKIFSDEMSKILNAFEASVNSKDIEAIKKGNVRMNELINEVFYLSALFEAYGISQNVRKAEKTVEGRVYFKMIKNAAKDSAAAQVIESEYAKTANEINAQLIKEKLKVAYPDLSEKYKFMVWSREVIGN